jgi:hypothetical protein
MSVEALLYDWNNVNETYFIVECREVISVGLISDQVYPLERLVRSPRLPGSSNIRREAGKFRLQKKSRGQSLFPTSVIVRVEVLQL